MVMWLGKTLIGILVINTLTMLTIARADRSKPTLKDDERQFRYGLFCYLKMNAKIIMNTKMNAKMNANMNAKSMPVSSSMNAKLTKLNTTFVYVKLINTLVQNSSN